MITVSDISTISSEVISISAKAKEYLEGAPFILDICNLDVDYVSIDSYVLDDISKAEKSILPDVFIKKGDTQQAIFKTNLIQTSNVDFLFEVTKNGIYKVLLGYQWKKAGEASVLVSIEHKGKTKSVSGNLFKKIKVSHEDLNVTVMCNGPRMQIVFN
ncbi:hypothetical protein [Shewanella waksmanii]|uniref:hypothetical protein n=1 Tax=Shewanella waksmanii TaxID=213783 RepID=UPI003734CE6B